MEAKEKAKELVDKFNPYADQLFMDDDHYSYDDKYRREQNAKQCGLICVDEIVELGVYWNDEKLVKDYPNKYSIESTYEFWLSVKGEIEKL